MLTKRDWEAVYGDVVAKGRARVDPPTPEEMVAYARHELSERDAERIREALGYYPELAAALTDDDEPAEHEPVLSDAELAADWQSLRRRMPPPVPHVRPVRTAVWQWAAAASFVLFALTATLYVRSMTIIARLENDLRSPRPNVERIVLFEIAPRGGSSFAQAIDLDPSAKYILLALALADPGSSRRFRVEIHDVDQSKLVWTGESWLSSDGTVSLEIPRAMLRSHNYAVVLYSGERPEPFTRYAFTIS